MTEGRDTSPPLKFGVDIPQEKAVEVWDFIKEKGKERFKGTAFVTGEKFEQKDIDTLKEFYQEVFDYQKEWFGKRGAVFNQSLFEHLSLAERLGERAAPLVGIDSYLFQAVILTHDLGRMFSHRRGRNNVMENTLTKQWGFFESFTKLMPPDTLWTDIDKKSLEDRLQKITSENGGIVGLTELIDVLAKWEDKGTGKLRKWEDVIKNTKAGQNIPDPATMWPSELKRQKKITSSEGNEAIETKYNYLKAWFESKSGKKIEDFIKESEETLRQQPLKESWI